MSERAINQVQLAKKSGIKQPLISNYLNESKFAKFPSLQNLIKIAEALNCTLEELTGLKTLQNIEKEMGKGTDNPILTEKALKVARFYESLDDDDPRKAFLEAYALKSDTESDKSKNEKKPK